MAKTAINRLTWQDFPAFVKEVEELARVREIRKQAKFKRDNATSFFVPGGIASAREEAHIAARAEALRGGSTATIEMPPSIDEMERDVLAAERLVGDQMTVVKREHILVKRQIGQHNLARWRAVVKRNREAILEVQSAAHELIAIRTEIVLDFGSDQEWGSPNAMIGGIAQPGALPSPLSVSCYAGENEFFHNLKKQVEHFVRPATAYLEASNNA